MNNINNRKPLDKADRIVGGHPVIANIFIIAIVAVLGLVIAYLSLGLFTKHGQTDTVPVVVNMSYSEAVEKQCILKKLCWIRRATAGSRPCAVIPCVRPRLSWRRWDSGM